MTTPLKEIRAFLGAYDNAYLNESTTPPFKRDARITSDVDGQKLSFLSLCFLTGDHAFLLDSTAEIIDPDAIEDLRKKDFDGDDAETIMELLDFYNEVKLAIAVIERMSGKPETAYGADKADRDRMRTFITSINTNISTVILSSPMLTLH